MANRRTAWFMARDPNGLQGSGPPEERESFAAFSQLGAEPRTVIPRGPLGPVRAVGVDDREGREVEGGAAQGLREVGRTERMSGARPNSPAPDSTGTGCSGGRPAQ